MVVGKVNPDTIQMTVFLAREKDTGVEKRACRFYVNDNMKPNTVAIFGNMYPVYKLNGQYYLKVKGVKHYNGCVFIHPFDTPLASNTFEGLYDEIR